MNSMSSSDGNRKGRPRASDIIRFMGKEKLSRKMRAALEAAAHDQTYVGVKRRIPGTGEIDGFVVGVGDRWMLMAPVSDVMSLDGLVALRLTDLTKVNDRGRDRLSFVRRALALRDEWPPKPHGGLDLAGVRELVQSAAAVSTLVTIHLEGARPEVCHIGRPVKVTSSSLHLLEISPGAEWDDRSTKYPLDALTRVDVGAAYEAALLAVGGLPAERRR
jgi:hypothetical protein